MRRVVFDTTVLVSAFLRPGGLADELLTLVAEGQFNLVLSSAIIMETWRTLIITDADGLFRSPAPAGFAELRGRPRRLRTGSGSEVITGYADVAERYNVLHRCSILME